MSIRVPKWRLGVRCLRRSPLSPMIFFIKKKYFSSLIRNVDVLGIEKKIILFSYSTSRQCAQRARGVTRVHTRAPSRFSRFAKIGGCPPRVPKSVFFASKLHKLREKVSKNVKFCTLFCLNRVFFKTERGAMQVKKCSTRRFVRVAKTRQFIQY
jgi:hypothetical protein